MLAGSALTDLRRTHGVLAIGVITTLESMGIPLPGESAVIAAAPAGAISFLRNQGRPKWVAA